MTRARSLASALAALTTLALAGAARDGGAAPARLSGVVSVSALPAASPPFVDARDKPKRVGANEHADGFYPVRPSYAVKLARTTTLVQVYESPTAASHHQGGTAAQGGACFLRATGQVNGDGSPGWMPSFQASATLMPVGGDKTQAPELVRSELLTRDADGRATLVVSHAWVDPETLGARLVNRASMALAPIALGPRGARVYGARTPTGVEIVFTGPESPFPQMATSTQAVTGDIPVSQAGCGHLRASLRTPRGDGDGLALDTQVALPLEDAAKEAPRGGLFGLLGGSSPFEGVRMRRLRTQVTTSWSGRDREPLVSVAMGWSGVDRTF